MFKEKRSHKRVKKTIFFRVLSSGFKEQASVDVSLGGLLMESPAFLDIDNTVGLELILPNDQPIYCQGRIAWVYPVTKNAPSYKVGVQFLNLSPREEEKLKNTLL